MVAQDLAAQSQDTEGKVVDGLAAAVIWNYVPDKENFRETLRDDNGLEKVIKKVRWYVKRFYFPPSLVTLMLPLTGNDFLMNGTIQA